MKVDCALVLAAGFGTRMGELGKSIPKPLWPIGNTTLLGHQIKLLKKSGIKEIYVNAHHQHELIEDYLSEFFPDVTPIHEPEILGSGGAIHNLWKKRSGKGRLLTFNSDLIIKFEDKFFKRFLDCDDAISLMGLKVKKPDSYRELIIENDCLINLSTTSNEIYYTYSGIANIDLERITYVVGESAFFDTVANFREREVKVIKPGPDEMSYLDFGTLELYFKNLKEQKTFFEDLYKVDFSGSSIILSSEINEFQFDINKREVYLIK